MKAQWKARLLMALVLLAGLVCASVQASEFTEAGRSVFEQFRSRSSLQYYARLNGPTLQGGPWTQNYNVFTNGPGPLQVFHSLTYNYDVDGLWSVGLEASAVHDLAHGIVGKFGTVLEPSTTWFHPGLKISRGSVIDNSWLQLWMGAIAYIPTSDFARVYQRQIVMVAFDQTWTVKGLLNSNWSLGINSRVEPTFYHTLAPRNSWDLPKRTLFVSAGHFLNYRFNDQFDVWTSTLFDAAKVAGAPTLLAFEDATDDRAQVMLNFYPGKMNSRLGGYFQTVVFGARASKATIGLEFEVGL